MSGNGAHKRTRSGVAYGSDDGMLPEPLEGKRPPKEQKPGGSGSQGPGPFVPQFQRTHPSRLSQVGEKISVETQHREIKQIAICSFVSDRNHKATQLYLWNDPSLPLFLIMSAFLAQFCQI